MLPNNIVAETLNNGVNSVKRLGINDNKFHFHISGIIASNKSNRFCPREYVLNYFSNPEVLVTRLTPGQQLLFHVGHAIHDLVCSQFISNSKYGKYVYGKWTCLCGSVVKVGYKPKKLTCKSCNTKAHVYNEIDLYSAKYKIQGHPDLLIMYKGKIYLYEIKTIDRQDVDFDSLKTPLADHHLQASCYYWLLVSMGYKVDKYIRYVYVDRNTRKIFYGDVGREFKRKRTEKARIKNIFNRSLITQESIKTRVLPDRICESATCTRAKNCTQATQCFSRKLNTI